jgi:hypothetical protein
MAGFNFSTQQILKADLKLKNSAIFIAGFNFSTQPIFKADLKFFNPANIKGFVRLKNSAIFTIIVILLYLLFVRTNTTYNSDIKSIEEIIKLDLFQYNQNILIKHLNKYIVLKFNLISDQSYFFYYFFFKLIKKIIRLQV